MPWESFRGNRFVWLIALFLITGVTGIPFLFPEQPISEQRRSRVDKRAPAATQQVRIGNRTGYPWVELYVAPTSRPAWGGNLLVKGPVPDNGWVEVALLPPAREDRLFDIMAIDVDKDRYLRSGVDLSKEQSVALTFEDFLEPRKEGWGWEEYFERYGNETIEYSKQVNLHF